MKLENIKKVTEFSGKSFLPGRGGRVYFSREEESDRPYVYTAKQEETTYSSSTVNYIDFYDVLVRLITGKKEVRVKDGYYTLRGIRHQDTDSISLVFEDKKRKMYGSILYQGVKYIALLNVIDKFRSNVPVYNVHLKDTDGDTVLLRRSKESLFIFFKNYPVKVNIPERELLKLSFLHYFEAGEMKPFLGNIFGAANKGELDGPHIIFGHKNAIVPITEEVAYEIYKIL